MYFTGKGGDKVMKRQRERERERERENFMLYFKGNVNKAIEL